MCNFPASMVVLWLSRRTPLETNFTLESVWESQRGRQLCHKPRQRQVENLNTNNSVKYKTLSVVIFL